jgi:GTP-binding protein
VAVPVVAIVGRPNVGKSSLFNWLAGRRIAIVDPTAGVTRDRVSTLVQADDRYLELVDTGGIGIEDVDDLTAQIERQIQLALDDAAVILFVVDGRAGVTPLDEEVAERLRHVHKPVLCLANKCDTPELDPQAAEFYRLGQGKVVCVSAQQNRGRKELLSLLLKELPEPAADEAAPKNVALKLAIVGRRNTGKSTFINSLAQSERMIVSEVPGTTRDSVDVRFARDGLSFVAIDTAGVRRKGSIQNDVEFYSLARAERSIRRADVVLLFLDARLRISKVDKQLADYILEQHKPAVFVVNKWDLMVPMPTGRMGDYIRKTFPNLAHVPIAFVTAKEGRNVHALLNLAQNLHKQASARVSTGDLNRVLRQAIAASPPPMRQNRRPKIFYGTQVGTNPPTVVLFTNGPELLDNTYLRYLLNTFRDQLPFAEVAIKMYVRQRNREDQAPVEEIETVEPGDVAPAGKGKGKRPSRKAPGAPGARKKDKRERKGRASELWSDV